MKKNQLVIILFFVCVLLNAQNYMQTTSTNPGNVSISHEGSLSINNLSVTNSFQVYSNQSGYTQRRLTFNTTEGDQSYIYNYDPVSQTMHTINIGGGKSLSSGITILSNGNVGIGTGTPNRVLHSVGHYNMVQLRLERTGSMEGFCELGGSDGDFRVWPGGFDLGHKFVIKGSNGNMGIGTTSPNQKLDIVGEAIEGGNTETDNTNKYFRILGKHYNSAGEEPICALMTSGSNGVNDVRIGGGTSLGNAATQISFYLAENSTTTMGTVKMIINGNGDVGIGTTNTYGHKLAVDGSILTTEVQVKLRSEWSDFVFQPDYNLRTLEETEQFIAKNGHLPDIPSAKQVEKEGISLGEMDAKLLQKIEELTLYMIEMKKENEELKERIKYLENQK